MPRCRRPRLAIARGAAALIVASGLLSACGDEAPPPPRTPELVGTQTVRRQPIARTISLAGTVAARVESDLSFRVAGRIAERRVDVSDHVKAGDVLATLDTTEQEADLQSARATLEAARATLSQADANFARQRQLNEAGYTTRSTLDAAQEQLRTAQGALEAARADVATAEDQLSFTVLRADAGGIVTARDAEAGQVVAAAQTVFTLAQDGGRDAVFDIYEALLTGSPPAEGITVSLVSNPAVSARATVREISPTFDTSTGSVKVKTTLLDPPPEMSLGAAVSGQGRSVPQMLVSLPWTALSRGAAGPAVWVVDPATHAVSLRPIAVQSYRTGVVLIEGGLDDGDIVVTAGAQLLREGQTVSIASEERP